MPPGLFCTLYIFDFAMVLPTDVIDINVGDTRRQHALRFANVYLYFVVILNFQNYQLMKIISWNCKKYYHAKAKLILSAHPDIVIVPECENPGLSIFEKDAIKPNDAIWFGDPKGDRGIGVFSYSNYKIKLLEIHNTNIRYVVPVSVTNNEFSFVLLAVWTHAPYTKQIWDGVKYYSNLLDGDIIIAGDFNSNSKWDNANKTSSHSDLVKHLESKNITSAYHYFQHELQGEETIPTFHWYHHENKPFHIDYCFASNSFINKLINVEIGEFKDWSKHSDHMPLTFTFDLDDFSATPSSNPGESGYVAT